MIVYSYPTKMSFRIPLYSSEERKVFGNVSNLVLDVVVPDSNPLSESARQATEPVFKFVEEGRFQLELPHSFCKYIPGEKLI
jgi:hypothetical protein